MLDATDDFAARRRRIAPGLESGDHVAAHRLIGQQSRGGTSTGLGPLDIGQVRRLDQRPGLRAFQALREVVEKFADRLIRHGRHRLESRFGALDRHGCRLLVSHRNQEQFTTDLLHQKVVTGLEPLSQFGADDSDTIPGEWNGRASD